MKLLTTTLGAAALLWSSAAICARNTEALNFADTLCDDDRDNSGRNQLFSAFMEELPSENPADESAGRIGAERS